MHRLLQWNRNWPSRPVPCPASHLDTAVGGAYSPAMETTIPSGGTITFTNSKGRGIMSQRALARGFAARVTLLFVCVTLGSVWLAAQSGPADLIITNGKVLTVDPNFSIAEAVAVKGNRIAAV